MTRTRNYRDEANSARQAARETLMAYRNARLQSRKRATAKPSGGSEDDASIGPEAFFSMQAEETGPAPDETELKRDTAGKTPQDAVAASESIETSEAGTAADDGASAKETGDASPPTNMVSESIEETTSSEDPPAENGDAEPEGQSLAGDPDETQADDVEEGAGQSAAENTASPGHDEDSKEGKQDAASSGRESEPTQPDDDPAAPSASSEEGESKALADRRIATVDADSDLFELPGAGAGMVWMFHQCGINSLSDLASADVRELSLRLGVVGHILNVEPWIAFAEERQGSAAN